jgi:two-component system response regulator
MLDENIILLAEDNSDDIEMVRRLFERNRIENELVVIQDGNEVLEYLFRQGPYEGRTYNLPSLILLGLRLPKIEGLEVLKQVKGNEQTSVIPIIFLISYRSEMSLVRESGLRADGSSKNLSALKNWKMPLKTWIFP